MRKTVLGDKVTNWQVAVPATRESKSCGGCSHPRNGHGRMAARAYHPNEVSKPRREDRHVIHPPSFCPLQARLHFAASTYPYTQHDDFRLRIPRSRYRLFPKSRGYSYPNKSAITNYPRRGSTSPTRNALGMPKSSRLYPWCATAPVAGVRCIA